MKGRKEEEKNTDVMVRELLDQAMVASWLSAKRASGLFDGADCLHVLVLQPQALRPLPSRRDSSLHPVENPRSPAATPSATQSPFLPSVVLSRTCGVGQDPPLFVCAPHVHSWLSVLGHTPLDPCTAALPWLPLNARHYSFGALWLGKCGLDQIPAPHRQNQAGGFILTPRVPDAKG